MVGYERGSEWRRWDLHIHTPGTKKNDQYIGSNLEEKWNNFYQSVNDYVGDGSNPLKNIAVIGITDYLSIDNCIKVIQDKRLPKSVKMILPKRSEKYDRKNCYYENQLRIKRRYLLAL